MPTTSVPHVTLWIAEYWLRQTQPRLRFNA